MPPPATLDSIRASADTTFLTKRPFGILITAQCVLSLLIAIGTWLSPFEYEGMAFVRSWSLSLFFLGLIFCISHVFGLNRRAIAIGTSAIYIPFALIIFIVSLIWMLLYAFSTLLSIISFFDALHYSLRLIITCLILVVLCAADTFVCSRLAILLYRATPNSKILALSTVVIDGERAVRMDAVPATAGGVGPSTGFTPAGGTPMGPAPPMA